MRRGVTCLVEAGALARLHLEPVRAALVPLLERGQAAICGVTELELLSAARNPAERARMHEQLSASLDRASDPERLWDVAGAIQQALTDQGWQHLASTNALLVAATAQAAALPVLHYDPAFDAIASCTGLPARWVVPPGTG